MAKIRPATESQVQQISYALSLMKQARQLLTQGGASSRCVDRLNAAIASAGGAERHARHRVARGGES